MLSYLLSAILIAGNFGPGAKPQPVPQNFPLRICTHDKSGFVNGRIQPSVNALVIEEYPNGLGIVDTFEMRKDIHGHEWYLINPVGGAYAWVRKDFTCENDNYGDRD